MTIVSWGDEYLRAQIVKQLHKLVDVKKVQLMDQDKIVVRELMMVKIKLEDGGLPEVMQAINAYRANVVDLSPSSIAVEIAGEPTKLNAFLHFLSKYEIV
jgi:acetolactate synthase-1/3 small subunit